MKVQRTFARAVPVLLAASFAMTAVAAFAQQTPAPSQPQTPQGEARDLLGRAQSARDGQMVEDLIRRLQGPEGPAPGVSPPAATFPAPAAPGASATPQVARLPPAATPVTPPPTARAPATPSTTPSAAPQPSTPSTAARPAEPTTPTVPSQRRLPRPAAPPVAAPVTSPAPTATAPVRPSVPLQAPLPTRSPNNIAPPSSAAAPPAAEPPAVGPAQQRLPQPPRRAATPPTIAPPPGADATPPPAPSQLPITPAQVERMDALPNIDVEVLFYLDSARLTNRAFATLAILGRALADERLAKQVFLIAGHTDATGPPDYNLALSERRAQAVRDFLIENFGIEPDRLLARGFGPERLKNPHSPGSRVNRRVQVVNWTSEADPSAANPPPPRR